MMGKLRRHVVLVKEGVYPYSGQAHLKPFSELVAAARRVRELPVTLEHPDESVVVDDTPLFGKVVNIHPNFHERTLDGTLEIDEDKLIAAGHFHTAKRIRAGSHRGVSLGFIYTPVKEAGEFSGQPYHIVQRNYDFNHLALAEVPRVPMAAHHYVGMDSTTGTPRAFTYDIARIGLDPIHPSFRSMYNSFIRDLGDKKGRSAFYATMNKFGFDESVSMRNVKNQAAMKRLVAARKKKAT